MIELSPDTEALARRLADQQSQSIDETVRQALEARQQRASTETSAIDLPADIIAARYAAIERAVREIAALPELDTRSAREIMDDLDPL